MLVPTLSFRRKTMTLIVREVTPQTSHKSWKLKFGSSRKGLWVDEIKTTVTFLGWLVFFQSRINVKNSTWQTRLSPLLPTCSLQCRHLSRGNINIFINYSGEGLVSSWKNRTEEEYIRNHIKTLWARISACVNQTLGVGRALLFLNWGSLPHQQSEIPVAFKRSREVTLHWLVQGLSLITLDIVNTFLMVKEIRKQSENI